MTRPHYMASIDACAAHYGDDADAMRKFLIAGHEKAMQLENRGPIAFDSSGALEPAFCRPTASMVYVFTDVLQPEELKDIEEDLEAMKQRFPVGPGEPSPPTDHPDSDLIALH